MGSFIFTVAVVGLLSSGAESPVTGAVRTFCDIPFVWIPAGTFVMGSPVTEPERDDDEPQRQVTLSQGFWLGRCEVTKGQWKAVMGTEPWKGKEHVLDDPNSPAVYVSWNDAQAFTVRLSARGEGVFGLPTEAEWEYACRAGTTASYSFGIDSSQLGLSAWYKPDAWDVGERFAHVVAQKQPNAWGFYDMHGNVWEWCSDGYWDNPRGNATDPKGPAHCTTRTLRGGSWQHLAWFCRSANRDMSVPRHRSCDIGFRLRRTE